jgi:hypothetical protein
MRMTVHIPDNLEPKLREAARNEGISLSALTARVLESYIKQKRKIAAGNRLLRLINRNSVAPEAWEELDRGRHDDRA